VTHALAGDDEEIFPGVRTVVTPGHSPGHTSYVITSSTGKRLIALGTPSTSRPSSGTRSGRPCQAFGRLTRARAEVLDGEPVPASAIMPAPRQLVS
jgi:glyoxylase-like metal-dependent hydrolase (beta-lactamase superfamily II)